jgi:hypothetical protein
MEQQQLLHLKCCDYCGKSYKRDSSLQKHKIPCKVLFIERVKRISATETEDPPQENMFSLKQVNLILSELVLQNKQMQEEIVEMKKFIFKTKMKINILDWLPLHVLPSYGFDTFIHNIIINQTHIEYLQEHKLLDTLYFVLNDIIQREKDNILPIFCFNEKDYKLYIYNSNSWHELERNKFITFMNGIHNKMLFQLKEWKTINEVEISKNDIYYNINQKMSIKIMDVDFNKDAILNKIRLHIFSKIKADIKNVIEYELV